MPFRRAIFCVEYRPISYSQSLWTIQFCGCMSAGPSHSVPFYEREMQMTSEMSEKSYKAVRCSYCSVPIPLSTRLLKLFVVESDKIAELRCQSHVFILRCEACSKES